MNIKYLREMEYRYARILISTLVMMGVLLANGQTNVQWNYLGPANFIKPDASYNYDLASCAGKAYVIVSDALLSKKATAYQFNGSSWEIIGEAGFTTYPYAYSIGAVSSCKCYKDTLYMVHSSAYAPNTVYKLDGSEWKKVSTSGFGSFQSQYVSLDFDTHGSPHVAYRGYSPYPADKASNSFVAKLVGTTWQNVGNKPLDTKYASELSMVMLGDVPYVASINAYDTLKVRKYDGANWVVVGSPIVSGEMDKALLKTNNGALYLAYTLDGKGYVTRFNGNIWEPLGQGVAFTGDYMDLEVVDDVPYVAYRNTSYKLSVIKYEDNSWKTVGSSNATAENFANYARIEFVNKTPVVSYTRGSDNKLSVLSYGLLTGIEDEVSDALKTSSFVYFDSKSGMINLQSDQEASVSFYTASGAFKKKVAVLGERSIAVDGLPSGVYICVYEQGAVTQRDKIVIY